ncbi:MAG: metal-dependent hydrolase [Planctomycetes bacterium]|nr:metal-dependent hydrolase [Planctomycetota bacterium]
MSPVTHGLLSWVLAHTPGVAPAIDRRGRAAITIAGLAPDLDGFGYPFQLLTRNNAEPLDWFTRFHHHLAHNLLATIVIAALACAWARGSWRVAVLALIAANLHMVCDLIGARGPDGNQWPIPYWQPFSDVGWVWTGQWRLDSWQNLVITLSALALSVAIALRHSRTPVEIASMRADHGVVATIRRWFRRTPVDGQA